MINLAAKALSWVVVPVVFTVALFVPVDHKVPISYDGSYNGYLYKAQLTKNPSSANFMAGRLEEITVTQNGKTVARFTVKKGWEVLYSENKKDVLELIKTLNKDMAEKYPYTFRGV